jgi:aminopeptidase N
MTSSRVLPAIALGLLAACSRPAATPPSPMPSDIHSHARPEIARVTHVALDLDVDFGRRRLGGTATLSLDVAPGAGQVILDTRKLDIREVRTPTGESLPFTLGQEDPILGQSLTVQLPRGDRTIVVVYQTRPDADALQWLTPEQTAGKKHPYLFSQGQAILTRTWIPTQDSPGIRQTYSATIAVPQDLRAVMSAEMLTPEGKLTDDGRRKFEFRLTHPVPAYLIAVAAGDIAFRSLGARTGVYTEPSMVEKAAHELAETEKMVEAAEALYGPYRWGRYDLLILPPSFPFGGMENPRLTFATPTILAGDRSLVSLVAHELAHSWSGNLVTNATWSDFWLNEGFTTYFENRIMERVYGADYAAMLRVLGVNALRETIEGFGTDSSQSILHIDLKGKNPDDGMTDVAYEKGAAFLRTIEHAVGRERFDAWLRSYFDRFAFQSQTSAGFLADLRTNLIQGDAALEARIRPDEWVYRPGLPSNMPEESSPRFALVDAQSARFLGGAGASTLDTKQWSTHEWLRFLNGLPDTLSVVRMAELDREFELSETGNSEMLFSWLRLAIRRRYEPAFPALERFLTTQGRRKFIRPLFQELMNTEWGKPMAREIYAKARPMYHSVTASSIDAIVR